MTLGLPIFEKQQVGRGGLVLYLPQRAAQSLGPWTVPPQYRWFASLPLWILAYAAVRGRALASPVPTKHCLG